MADVEIGSVTITTVGGPVLLIGKGRFGTVVNTTVRLWLTSVGGTKLDETFTGTRNMGTGVVMKIHEPSAGTHTYKLSGDNGGSGFATFRRLEAVELRK